MELCVNTRQVVHFYNLCGVRQTQLLYNNLLNAKKKKVYQVKERESA